MRRYITSNSMQAQIDSLAETMVHTDEVAVQMINGQLPSIYADSYNFAGFRGEKYAEVAGYDYHSFNIYNSDAVRILMKEDPDLIPALKADRQVNVPEDERWNRQHIQSAITQGIVQGDSVDKIAQRLQSVAEMDDNSAIRNARTAVTAVENEARRDATERIKEAGIPMTERWVATIDSRTRDTHLLLDGTNPNEEGLFGEGILDVLLRFPGDPNGEAHEIYNCRCGVSSSLPGIDHSKDMELYEQFMQKEYYDDWLAHKEKEQDSSTYVGAKRLEYEYGRQRQAELRGEVPEQPTGATNRAEAINVFENDLGFVFVSENVSNNMDEELFVAQANRLEELNARFGVIDPERNVGAITLEDDPEALASVTRPRTGDIGDAQTLSFNPDFFTDIESHNAYVTEKIEDGWFMPVTEENLEVSTVTHEYGHMLETRIIENAQHNPELLDTMFEYTKNEVDELMDILDIPSIHDVFTTDVLTPAESEELVRDCIMSELQEIMIRNYPQIAEEGNLLEYVSRYGMANSSEFFAEGFMTGQCGEDTVMGEAVNEWLRRLGYDA